MSFLPSDKQPCLLGGGPQAPPARSTVGGGERERAAVLGNATRHQRQVCVQKRSHGFDSDRRCFFFCLFPIGHGSASCRKRSQTRTANWIRIEKPRSYYTGFSSGWLGSPYPHHGAARIRAPIKKTKKIYINTIYTIPNSSRITVALFTR